MKRIALPAVAGRLTHAADTPDTAYAVIGFRLIAHPRTSFIHDQAGSAAFGTPR